MLVCKLSYYRLSLPDEIRNDRILLLVDGHPSRYNYEAALILYLFDIDLVLIAPHTSHLLQAFDVAISAPLKTYFKEELLFERFDYYLLNGFKKPKQTARDLRKSMIKLTEKIKIVQKEVSKKYIRDSFDNIGFLIHK